MNILELEIEDVIWKGLTEDVPLLARKGFPAKKHYTYVRQLDLNGYGRADIVGFRVSGDRGDRCIYIDIIELKKDLIDSKTLLQSAGYATGIKTLFMHEGLSDYECFFSFYLIGKSIDEQSSFCYLADHLENVAFLTYSIDLIEGIKFTTEKGYALIEPSFQKNSRKLIPILKSNIRQNYTPGATVDDITF